MGMNVSRAGMRIDRAGTNSFCAGMNIRCAGMRILRAVTHISCAGMNMACAGTRIECLWSDHSHPSSRITGAWSSNRVKV